MLQQMPDYRGNPTTDASNSWHWDGWGGHYALWIRMGVGNGTGVEDVLWNEFVTCAVCSTTAPNQEGFIDD